jgi:hypothetical protein
MEAAVGLGLIAIVVLIACLINPDFRQGWRNSKFLDELKEDKDSKDLTRM